MVRSFLHPLFATIGFLLIAVPVATPSPALSDAQGQFYSAFDDDPSRAQQFFIRGLTSNELGDTEQAIHLFDRALQYAPNAPAILSAMADAQAEAEDLSAAVRYARQARAEAPENRHYHEQLAALQRDADRPEETLETYDRLVEEFSGATDSRLDRARLLVEMDQTERALEEYEIVRQEMGRSPQLEIEMLQLYRSVDDNEGIRRSLESLVEMRPEENIFRLLLSQHYEDTDDRDAAIDLYERILHLHPEDLDAALELAALYREEGDEARADSLLDASVSEEASLDQLVNRAESMLERDTPSSADIRSAEDLLERTLDINEEHQEAAALLGSLRYEQGQFGEAATLLKEALEDDADSAERWFQAAAAHLQSDRPRQAAEIAEEGLDQFPQHLSLVRVAAYALTEINENESAIDRFEEAIALLDEAAPGAAVEAERADYKASLGLLYNRIEEVEASDEYYQRVLDIDPEHDMALNNYAYSLAERDKKLDKALEMAEQAVDLDSSNASYLDTLGWVHYKRGNLEAAEKWVKRSLDTGEASPTVYEHYGDIHEAMGDLETAQQYWREALERDPDRTHLEEKLDMSPQ